MEQLRAAFETSYIEMARAMWESVGVPFSEMGLDMRQSDDGFSGYSNVAVESCWRGFKLGFEHAKTTTPDHLSIQIATERERAAQLAQALKALLEYHDDIAKAADQRLLNAGYEALDAFNKD